MDKRSAANATLGSKDNPITLQQPESTTETKKWTKAIDPEKMNPNKILGSIEKLSPWLDLSQKLGVQANSILMGAAALKKQDKLQVKVDVLMDRLRPILALKEDIDLYISSHCELILDNLECGNYLHNYAKMAKENNSQ